MITIFILEIVFLFVYVKYNFDNNLLLSEIENNLNGKLIYSLKTKIACDADEEELVLGMWDGLKEGCFCKETIYDEKCTEKLINQRCKIIPASNPIKYLIINSKYICVKKSGPTYRDLLLKTNQIVKKDQSCPKLFKSCGIIDTLERKFCVKEDEPCPINDSIINTNEYEDMLFDIFNIGPNNSKDNKENKILSIFKLNQKIPCINPTEAYWNYHYILEAEDKKCTTGIKNKIYDDRFELFPNFTVNKYDLYYDNSILPKLLYINEIDLNKIKNDNLFLFGNNFYGFNKKKLSNYNYDKLLNEQNYSNDCNKVMKNSGIVFAALIIIALVIYLVILCKVHSFSIYKFEIECENAETSGCSKNTWFTIISIIVIFIDFYFFIICCIIFNCYKNIESILNFKGSDEYLTVLFDELLNEYVINYRLSLAIIILFSCFPVTLIIGCFCWCFCCSDT